MSGELDQLRKNPPDWAKCCPNAYSRYLDAHEKVNAIFDLLPKQYQSLVKDVHVALAIAWTAGQNSINEKVVD